MLSYRRETKLLVMLLIVTSMLGGWMMLYPTWLNLANLWVVKAEMQQSPPLSIQAQQWFEQLASSPVAAQAERNNMKLAVIEGRMEDAIPLGEHSLSLQPLDQMTSHFLGTAYWELGGKERARAIWGASGILPQYLDLLATQGWQSFAAGESDQGVGFFEQGIDYDPAWIEGYWALSSFYWQNEEVAKAVPSLERLVTLLPPEDPRRTFAQARLALADDNLPTATALFCRAWKSDPMPEYLHGCLWGMKYLGDAANALMILRSAATIFPDQVAAEAQAWADRLAQSGNQDDAANFLELACSASARSSEQCRQSEAE